MFSWSMLKMDSRLRKPLTAGVTKLIRSCKKSPLSAEKRRTAAPPRRRPSGPSSRSSTDCCGRSNSSGGVVPAPPPRPSTSAHASPCTAAARPKEKALENAAAAGAGVAQVSANGGGAPAGGAPAPPSSSAAGGGASGASGAGGAAGGGASRAGGASGGAGGAGAGGAAGGAAGTALRGTARGCTASAAHAGWTRESCGDGRARARRTKHVEVVDAALVNLGDAGGAALHAVARVSLHLQHDGVHLAHGGRLQRGRVPLQRVRAAERPDDSYELILGPGCVLAARPDGQHPQAGRGLRQHGEGGARGAVAPGSVCTRGGAVLAWRARLRRSAASISTAQRRS